MRKSTASHSRTRPPRPEVRMSATLAPLATALARIDNADGEIITHEFLAACRLVLPVFDKLGVAFGAAKSDVSGNIERLGKHAGNHALLFDICREDIGNGTQASNSGCCKGLLWLKRFLEFTVELLNGLVVNESESLKIIANSAYESSLKPYHGWLASSAFTVVLQFPPSREVFMESLDGDYAGIRSVTALLKPALTRIHEFLVENSLHDESKV